MNEQDSFAVPFEEICAIVDRSPDAAKQPAHRARRKVRGIELDGEPIRPASGRSSTPSSLLRETATSPRWSTMLHSEIVLRADTAAMRMGSPAEARGAPAVARMFQGRAPAARPVLIDGAVGLIWAVGGRLCRSLVDWETAATSSFGSRSTA